MLLDCTAVCHPMCSLWSCVKPPKSWKCDQKGHGHDWILSQCRWLNCLIFFRLPNKEEMMANAHWQTPFPLSLSSRFTLCCVVPCLKLHATVYGQSLPTLGGALLGLGSGGPSFPLCFYLPCLPYFISPKKKSAPAQMHLLPPEHWHTPFHLSFPTQNTLTTRSLGAEGSRRSSTIKVPSSLGAL